MFTKCNFSFIRNVIKIFLPASLYIGKSALHWAAAVNNVEAALVLLKNGSNKDLQNNKVCTCVQ